MNISLLFYFKNLIVFLCLWDSLRHGWLVTSSFPRWKLSVVLVSFSPGKNPEDWAKDLKQTDFELLCLDGTRKPVTEAQNCHLGTVPNHAVVSRKNKADSVRRMLFNQQVWQLHAQLICRPAQTHPSPVSPSSSLGSGTGFLPSFLWWKRKAAGCVHFLLWAI